MHADAREGAGHRLHRRHGPGAMCGDDLSDGLGNFGVRQAVLRRLKADQTVSLVLAPLTRLNFTQRPGDLPAEKGAVCASEDALDKALARRTIARSARTGS